MVFLMSAELGSHEHTEKQELFSPNVQFLQDS